MFSFIARRLGLLIPSFFGITLLTFALIRLIPGDPVEVMMGERRVDPEMHAQAMERLGLNKPLPEQFITYLGKSVRGDLGMSYTYNKPVSSLISERIGPTILLVLTALLVAIVVGTLLGVFASLKPKSFSSAVVTVFSLTGLAMPVFWTGILLVILFGKVWPVMPIAGMYDVRNYGATGWAAALDVLHHLVLPALTLTLVYLAQYSPEVILNPGTKQLRRNAIPVLRNGKQVTFA